MINWSSSNFKEIFPDRLSEFTNSVVPHLFNKAFRSQYSAYDVELPEEIFPLVETFSHKMFLNLSGHEWIGARVWRQDDNKLTQLIGGHRIASAASPYKAIDFRPPTFIALWFVCVSVAAWVRQDRTYARTEAAEFIHLDVGSAIDCLERHLCDHLKVGVIAGAIHSQVHGMVKRFCAKHGGDPFFLLGTPEKAPNILRQRAWEDLLVEFNDPARVSKRNEAARNFLRDYGHRHVFEMEISIPRPAEDISIFIEHVMESAYRAQSERGGTLRDPTENVRGIGKIFVGILARLSACALTIRERSKSVLASDAFRLRQALIRFAERHISAGFSTPEDIFWLRYSEIREIENGRLPNARVIIQARRKKVAPKPPPDTFVGDAAGQVQESNITESRNTVGTTVSSGVVEGRVRVLRSHVDMRHILAGDIIVVNALDSGWSDVFSYAGGVITETGGTMSHAAILLREQNIPALFNVHAATDRLHDGSWVTLDATGGEILQHGDN